MGLLLRWWAALDKCKDRRFYDYKTLLKLITFVLKKDIVPPNALLLWMNVTRQAGCLLRVLGVYKRKEGRSGHIPTDGAVLSIPSLVTLALAILAGAVLYTQGTAHTLITCLPCPALFTAAWATHTHAVSPTVHRAHLCRHIPETCYISIFNNKIIWTTTKQSNFQLIIRWWYYQVSWCLQIKYQHHFFPPTRII